MATREEVIFKVSADLQGFKKSMYQLKKIAEESSKKIEKAMDMNLTDEGSRAGKTFSNGINNQMKSVTDTIKNELKKVAEQASEIEINASLSKSAIDNIKQQLSDVEDNILTVTDRSSASMSDNANAPNNSDSSGIDGVIDNTTTNLYSALGSIREEITKTFDQIKTEAASMTEVLRQAMDIKVENEQPLSFIERMNNGVDGLLGKVWRFGDELSQAFGQNSNIQMPAIENLGYKIQHFANEELGIFRYAAEKTIASAKTMGGALGQVSDSIGKVFAKIGGVVGKAVTPVLNIVGNEVVRFGNRLAFLGVRVLNPINAIRLFAKTLWSVPYAFVSAGIDGAINAFNKIGQATVKLYNTAKNTLGRGIQSVCSGAVRAFDWLKNGVSTACNNITMFFESAKNGVKTGVGSISNAIKAIPGAIKAVPGAVHSGIVGIGNALSSTGFRIKTFANNLQSNMAKATASVKTFAVNVKSNIKQAVTNLGTNLVSAVKNARKSLTGFKDGMRTVFKNMKDISDSSNKAANGIKKVGDAANSASGKTSKLSGALKGLISKLAMFFGIYQIFNLFKEGTKDAMQYEAAIMQLQNRMGSASKSLTDFIDKTAIMYGISKKNAAQYANIYSVFVSEFTTSAEECVQYTQKLLGAAGVIAASTGYDLDFVLQGLRSGIMGSTAAIDQFGLSVKVGKLETTELFQEMAKAEGVKSFGDLSAAAQRMIITQEILNQVSKNYGGLLYEISNNAEEVLATAEERLKTAANIIGSYENIDAGKMFRYIEDAVNGSTRALEKYGYKLDRASIESSESFAAMANGATSLRQLTNEQVRAIYVQEILNQTVSKYGGALKSTAVMHSVFTAQLANTKLALGNVGKAIWTAVLPAFTKLMSWLETAFNTIAKVMSAILGLFGIKVNFSGGTGTSLGGLSGGLDDVGGAAGGASDALNDAANAAGGAGDAAQGAAKDTEDAAKKIKRALAGFDQINVLSLGDDSDSDPGSGSPGGGSPGGGSPGGGSPGNGGGGGDLNDALTDVEIEMDDTLSGMAESFMNWVKSINFDPLIESFNRLKESVQPIIETCGKLVMWFLTDVLGPLAKFTIEEVLPRFFDTLSNILRILAPILDAAVDAFITFNNAVLIPIAKWTAGVFLEVWDAVLAVLKAFGDWLNGDGAWCAEILGTLAGSLAVVGEVFLVVVAAIKTGVAIFNGITTAIELAGAAFSFITSPIGLTIAAITAVVAAVVLCIQHWDEIKEAMGPVWDVIKDVWDKIAAAATELYKDHIQPLIDDFIALGKAVWDCAKQIWDEAIKPLWDLIKPFLSWLLDTFIENTKKKFQLWGEVIGVAFEVVMATVGVLSDLLGDIIQVITGLTEAIVGVFSGDWEKAWEGIKKAFGGFIDFFADLYNGLGDIFAPVVDFFKEKFTKAWNEVKKVWEKVTGWFGNIWEDIKAKFKPVTDWFKEKFEAAKKAVEKAWNGVCDFFKGIWDGIKKIFNPDTWFGVAFADGADDAEGAFDGTPEFFKGIWKGIKDAFNGVKKWFSDLFSGAWTGIKTAWDGATGWFSDIWTGIKKAFPSVGKWFSDTFSGAWDGIKKAWSNVTGWFDDIWESIKGAFDGAKDWKLPKPSISWGDLKDSAGDALDKVKEKITKFTASLPKPNIDWDSIKDTAKTYIDKAKEKVTGFVASLPKPTLSWDSIKDTAKGFVDKAKEKVTGFAASLPKPTVSWDSIKDTAKTYIDKAKEKVTGFSASLPKPSVSWSSIATSAKDFVDAAKKKVTSFSASLPKPSLSWSSLATSAKSAVDNAKKKVTGFSASLPKPKISWNLASSVGDAISAAKKKMNFSWSLPKPKTPKFTAQWKTVFGVKIPSGFSISWHAKGGIMTKPTIFGINGNNLLAGGEAGHEAVLPLEKLWSQLANQFNRQNEVLSSTVASVGSGSSGPVNITLKINDIEMGKAVINSLKALSDHSGEIDLPL